MVTAVSSPLSGEMAEQKAEVVFTQQGQIGIITMNRPQALNALTLGMVRAMNAQLEIWSTDDDVQAIIIRGTGGRAFCAGGDVKAVALATRAADPATAMMARDFFYEEYTLNHRIFTYPKPYIALIEGIVMGGGVGVSAHGSFRVVAENATLAMPETIIGFFPDVGGGYFLPRCPGQTGTYLALTGQRIGAIDAIYCGFATHYVPASQHGALLEALAQKDFADEANSKTAVEEVLARFAEEVPGESMLAPVRGVIDRCFGHDRMEDIVADLASEETDFTDFAAKTLQALYAVSPTSLKVTLRQLREGATLHFAKVMTMEYRLSQAMVKHPDFYEGIRAALIDKDKQPKWHPARTEEVSDAQVDAFFAPRDGDELVLS